MEKTIKAALFDLDGTLIDTESLYTELWRDLGARFRPDVPDLAARIKGTSLQSIFRNYFPDKTVQAAIEKEVDTFESQMPFRIYDGALELLDDLRRHGVRLSLVTSSSPTKVANVRRRIPELVSKFDLLLQATDFPRSKPAPDCYLKAAAMLGVELQECIIFEDAPNGLQAGTSSGIFTFGMATTCPGSTIAKQCDCVLGTLEGENYESILRHTNCKSSDKD